MLHVAAVRWVATAIRYSHSGNRTEVNWLVAEPLHQFGESAFTYKFGVWVLPSEYAMTYVRANGLYAKALFLEAPSRERQLQLFHYTLGIQLMESSAENTTRWAPDKASNIRTVV